MTNIKLIAYGICAGLFLLLVAGVWYFHKQTVELEKTIAVKDSVIKGQAKTIQGQVGMSKINNAVTASAAAEADDLNLRQIKNTQRVDNAVRQIQQKYQGKITPIPGVISDDAAKASNTAMENEISKVRIASVLAAYCDGVPDALDCIVTQ